MPILATRIDVNRIRLEVVREASHGARHTEQTTSNHSHPPPLSPHPPQPKQNPTMPSPALELASTLQSASINRSPSPHHDINPSTAASRKIPVTVSESAKSSTSIPSSAIKPIPRRRNALPPLPDLRFEQSYLASLQGAESGVRVAWITVRDQVRCC